MIFIFDFVTCTKVTYPFIARNVFVSTCFNSKLMTTYSKSNYDVCMYIWTPLNPQTGILVKTVVFLKIPCACHNVVFVIECYVLKMFTLGFVVIKYIYFTTIFKNGWMENKEISFFIRLWFIVELCYCYSWKGTRPCYIQWWSSFSLCILFNYIASLTGTDLWWLSARIDIGMLLRL